MKHIYVNFKRFDVSKESGGVNSIATIDKWASYIIENIETKLTNYDSKKVDFTLYFPEAHLIEANNAKAKNSPINLGSQSVYRDDLSVGGNFGAFTTNRPASVVKELGCSSTIIGHCEERNDKAGILKEAGVVDNGVINRILNKEVKTAIDKGLSVLYCVGEKTEEMDNWEEVIGKQLELGLKDVDTKNIVIAYEPIWSIGPGKTPAGKDYITKIAKFIKEKTNGLDVVYGGGLKEENAEMLSSIDDIDGGLIALTRFKGEIGFYPDEFLKIVEKYLGE